jgi:hypothetical protein
MLQHDWMLSRQAEEHRRDLMRQLEHDRLVGEAEFAKHPHWHLVYHVMDWVGRQFVHWGERLQARHTLRHRQTLNHNVGGRL